MRDLTAKQIIQKARTGIILSHKTAFYASLMMGKPMIEDRTRETASTNGLAIRYNPSFIESLTIDETIFLILHELCHIYSFHHTRRGARELELWNEACDYVINWMLVNAGFKMPKGGLLDARFKGMSAETAYAILEKERRQQPQPQSQPQAGGSGQPSAGQGQQQPGNSPANGGQQNKPQPNLGMGGVEDAPAQSKSDITQMEEQIKRELAQAVAIAKGHGDMPADMERIVRRLLKPVIDWKETLARFILEVARNDYSFSRPNARYLHTGFILPSLYSQEVGEIVIFADTSSSMDEKLLNESVSEAHSVAATLNKEMRILYIDTMVHGEGQIIYPDEDFNLVPIGGGGTDFRPGFKYIAEHNIEPAVVIYFTDGDCAKHKFPPEPDVPVLWIIYDNDDFDPPFGEVIHIR